MERRRSVEKDKGRVQKLDRTQHDIWQKKKKFP